MPNRSLRLAGRSFDRYGLPLFVSTVLFLLLLGFARIYTVTNDLKRAQHEACLLRRAGRANTNEHDRVPLKAALQYLGDAVEQSAAKQPDGPKKEAALSFAHQFQAYAAAVQPLANPKC